MRFADSRFLRLFGQSYVTRSHDTSVVERSLSAQIYIKETITKPEVRSNNVAPLRPCDADMARRFSVWACLFNGCILRNVTVCFVLAAKHFLILLYLYTA